MALINIPDKTVGNEYTADEQNQMKNGLNQTYEEALSVSHILHEHHFKIQGTAPDENNEPKPVVVINYNPDHFEIVNGTFSIKANLLA